MIADSTSTPRPIPVSSATLGVRRPRRTPRVRAHRPTGRHPAQALPRAPSRGNSSVGSFAQSPGARTDSGRTAPRPASPLADPGCLLASASEKSRVPVSSTWILMSLLTGAPGVLGRTRTRSGPRAPSGSCSGCGVFPVRGVDPMATWRRRSATSATNRSSPSGSVTTRSAVSRSCNRRRPSSVSSNASIAACSACTFDLSGRSPERWVRRTPATPTRTRPTDRHRRRSPARPPPVIPDPPEPAVGASAASSAAVVAASVTPNVPTPGSNTGSTTTSATDPIGSTTTSGGGSETTTDGLCTAAGSTTTGGTRAATVVSATENSDPGRSSGRRVHPMSSVRTAMPYR